MMANTLTLSAQSRYKDTDVYTTDTYGRQFALWEAPSEFSESYEDARLHEVKKFEIGMLDKIAVTYYGPGQEVMWWVIAQANGLIDPETDMYVGQKLVIPPRSALLNFVARV